MQNREPTLDTMPDTSFTSSISHIGLAADLVLLYKSDGLPLYSRCFGEFCLKSTLQPGLVTSFLEAITLFSSELTGEVSHIKKIEFFGMEMNFRRLGTTPVRLVVILHDSRPGDQFIVDEICLEIDKLIDEKYPQVMAMGVDNRDLNAFYKELECEILNPFLHYAFPETDMQHHTHCPYCQDLLFSAHFENKDDLSSRLLSQYAEIYDILDKKPELITETERDIVLAKVRKRINPDC